LIVAPLKPSDYDSWLPLWLANMENSVSDEITSETWRRICDPAHAVGGLGVRAAENSPLTGICHYITHPTTGNLNPVCYMQDLYIDPSARRQGLARTLVTYLAALGTASGWARLYWLAEAENAGAQALYKSLGYKLNFTLHVLPLNMPTA
jgi:ribosomal protein S18 acetylase RimI-like enzyme